jgi:hypothetical protein
MLIALDWPPPSSGGGAEAIAPTGRSLLESLVPVVEPAVAYHPTGPARGKWQVVHMRRGAGGSFAGREASSQIGQTGRPRGRRRRRCGRRRPVSAACNGRRLPM